MPVTPSHELDRFFAVWESEAQKTIKLLQSLPRDKYDFRPDAGGRSLGELSWHLAELDGYVSYGLEIGSFDMGMKVPNLERPRSVEALAPGYERIHREAVARVRKLKPEDLGRTVTFFMGKQLPIGDILWDGLLHHAIHHRGQLSIMNRIAGGASPGMYGPNREEMAASKAKAGV
jgi:uncharacterized damage-inducible protein DinB